MESVFRALSLKFLLPFLWEMVVRDLIPAWGKAKDREIWGCALPWIKWGAQTHIEPDFDQQREGTGTLLLELDLERHNQCSEGEVIKHHHQWEEQKVQENWRTLSEITQKIFQAAWGGSRPPAWKPASVWLRSMDAQTVEAVPEKLHILQDSEK